MVPVKPKSPTKKSNNKTIDSNRKTAVRAVALSLTRRKHEKLKENRDYARYFQGL